MSYKYGNAWEQFPIRPGQVWGIPGTSTRMAVHDIFDPLPAFMFTADLLFVDPPWEQGNLTCFYTKARRTDYKRFDQFSNIFFKRVEEISSKCCYIEIGKKSVGEWYARLKGLYKYTQKWSVTYYNKYPTFIIRGSQEGKTSLNFTGVDEAKCIKVIAQKEDYNIIGDMCMGRGLVGVAAFEAGKSFVGTELNERRIANLLQKIHKMGGDIQNLTV